MSGFKIVDPSEPKRPSGNVPPGPGIPPPPPPEEWLRKGGRPAEPGTAGENEPAEPEASPVSEAPPETEEPEEPVWLPRCFLSYDKEDEAEVKRVFDIFDPHRYYFIQQPSGYLYDQNLMRDKSDDYFLHTVRRDYLQDSEVTVLLIGKHTWARRYVDWEIAASIRATPFQPPNGLVAILLPAIPRGHWTLPTRFEVNWDHENNGKSGYAKFYRCPVHADELVEWVTEAYHARETRKHLINNTRPLLAHDKSYL